MHSKYSVTVEAISGRKAGVGQLKMRVPAKGRSGGPSVDL